MLYPDELQALRKQSIIRKHYCHIKKKSKNTVILFNFSTTTSNQIYFWSGQRDSNPRPPAPKAGALPNCAIPRNLGIIAKWAMIRTGITSVNKIFTLTQNLRANLTLNRLSSWIKPFLSTLLRTLLGFLPSSILSIVITKNCSWLKFILKINLVPSRFDVFFIMKISVQHKNLIY